MTIAYMLVTGTYMLLGGAFYICFPLPKFCIEDVSFPLYWSRIVEKDLSTNSNTADFTLRNKLN